jgi:membrane associated rhomboid family serine protease
LLPINSINFNFFTGLIRFLGIVWTGIKKAPWKENYVTLFLAALVLLLFLIPGSQTLLQYQRDLVESGEWWRLFTCSFVHSGPNHFIWNFITLLSSSLVAERMGRKRFVIFLFTCMGVMAIWHASNFNHAWIRLGFSGIASGSFALLLIRISIEGWKINEFWIGTISLLLLVLFIAHEAGAWLSTTPWEYFTGEALGGGTGKEIKGTHIVGIAVGVAIALIPPWPWGKINTKLKT